MDREQNLKVREIFSAAAEKPAGDRTAYLDGACGGDTQLRGRVTELLGAFDRAGELRFLDGATVGGASLPPDEATNHSEGVGSRIGPYKILEPIGEGGFGIVYMAEQEHPVRRRVALKVIKRGMDTKQVLARFEAERQALALMDHPNIAKVLDAGSTEAGRPYFVMELVKGVPVTEYCDASNLTTRERLELFVQVCRAVQHAHQKGVIHRDLKPSNVLVTLHDGVPVPKVIDFGIAKATQSRLTEKTLFTEFRQLVGTPAYMSPEQAEMSGLDVDTRSDVYALGVLLYELLTGTTPFDARELCRAAYGEIQRIIREVEPPRPSTRLGTMGASLTAVAAHRRTEPAKLGELVRGELDWIVMKALEKDRARRYETATDLAADVLRYLHDELVQARPPSRAYKVRKFARRNRLALAAAGAVAASLLLGLGVATVGFLRASAARDRAVTAHTHAEHARAAEATHRRLTELALAETQQARVQAEISRDHAKAVNDLLHEIFVNVNRRRTGDETAFARALKEAADKVDDGALRDQPEVEAAVHATLGNIYFSWGAVTPAEHHLRAALNIRQQLAPPEGNLDLGKSLSNLGWVLRAKGDHNAAEAILKDSLEMHRRLLGDKHGQVASNLHALAMVYFGKGDNLSAYPLVRESLSIRLTEATEEVRRRPDDDRAWGQRGHVRARGGDFAGAIADFTEATKRDPDDHWWYHLRLPLRLYVGDREGYRAEAREMFRKFANSPLPEAQERALKCCLLSPDAVDDPAELKDVCDRMMASSPPPYFFWFQVTKGMYEYRNGQYKSAVGWLRRGREGIGVPPGRALADFYLAMAHHKLGEASLAESSMARGKRLMPEDTIELERLDPGADGSMVTNWVFAQIARREAESLIHGTPPVPDAPARRRPLPALLGPESTGAGEGIQ